MFSYGFMREAFGSYVEGAISFNGGFSRDTLLNLSHKLIHK